MDEAFEAALTTALQIHDMVVHTVQAQPAPPRLKLDAPTVAAGCDPDQWSVFTRQWYMYKVGMSIAVSVLPTALFYCCDPDLRTYILCDLRGDVTNMVKVNLPGSN